MDALSATPDYQSNSQRPLKETLILALVFLLVFCPFQAIQDLQSSLNQLQGLGVSSLASLYGAMFVVSFFTPAIVYHLGVKGTIIMAWVGHTLYVLCNFYPSWITLIPGSLLLGLISCPLWTSAETYLSALSRKAVELDLTALKPKEKGNTLHAAFSRLNGVFQAVFIASQLIGNLLSSIILSQSALNEHSPICGAEYCPLEGKGNQLRPPEERILFTLLGVFLVADIIGLLITARFLPNLVQPQYTGREIGRKLKSYWIAFRQPKLWMLVPLFACQGMIFTIYIGLFTEAFVSCSLGIKMVGYVMAVWGFTTMLSSALLGYAARFTGRQFLCGFAFVVDTCILLTLLLWRPHSEFLVAFLCLAALMGLVAGIWQVQITALVAVMFPSIVDSAFAVRGTWYSLTMCASWLAAKFLCPATRIYTALGLLTAGLVGYVVVEVVHRRGLRSFDRDDHEYILLNNRDQQGEVEDDYVRESEATEETLFDARVSRRNAPAGRKAATRGAVGPLLKTNTKRGKVLDAVSKDDDHGLEDPLFDAPAQGTSLLRTVNENLAKGDA